MTHADRLTGGTSDACENRNAARAEAARRYRAARTQSVDDLVRQRIRDRREALGLSQAELARRMTDAEAPLTNDKVSKIESGKRLVTAGELFAFADVLEVPYAWLVTPRGGDRAVRVSNRLALDAHDVSNWLVFGHPWSETARGAQELMRLPFEIAYWLQAHEDAKRGVGPESPEYIANAKPLVKRLRTVTMRPGVIRRTEAERRFLRAEQERRS